MATSGIGADQKAAACWMGCITAETSLLPDIWVWSWAVCGNSGRSRVGDFEMVYTSADGHVEWLSKAAEELVQLNPDIIIASATIQAVAAKKATDTIPIVVPVLADPIGLGFVASEARPGANVTGIAPYRK